MELKYRSDIDGLRAIAVLSVLFFHTEVPGFSGGYVGVDVFFVISGFLITNIILKDIQEGRFSVARFYERRIRRIFPALFPVIFFVLVFGILFYYPSAMRDLGMSINTTTLFSSNIYFLRQSGYFDAAVIVKPLLHTWSLAVEEQFYIVFPLLLMFISRFLRGKYFPWLIVIFVLSFLGNIYFIKLKPDMVFYMMPTRAWELITGSMLAFGVFPVLLANWQKNLLSFSGIAMIMYSAIFYDSSTLFPGYAALLPVMGSGLVIYSGIGEGNYALYRILSFRPLVFIGLISYSLYLWHWSLVTFVKYIIFDQFNWIASLLIIIVSLVFAVLSWRYIEKPFRGKNSLVPDRKVLFIYAGLLMMVTVGIGTAIYATNGLYGFMTASEIFGTKKNTYTSESLEKPILIGDINEAPDFVLWGDSHAGALAPAINYKAKEYHISGYVFSHGNTLPIFGYGRKAGFDDVKFNTEVLSFVVKHKIKNVFLAGAWSNYVLGKGTLFMDGKPISPSEERLFMLASGLKKTIQTMRNMGLNVYFVCDVPRWNVDPVRFYYLKERYPDVAYFSSCVEKIEYIYDFERLNQKFNSEVQSFADKNFGADHMLKPDVFFDSKGSLSNLIRSGKLMYGDSNHLSYDGSIFVSSIFDKPFKRIADKASSSSGK